MFLFSMFNVIQSPVGLRDVPPGPAIGTPEPIVASG
jgi:hypothetical protein